MAQAETTSAHAYDSADLATPLRRQLGVKLFECARTGERDYTELRQRILARMFSGTPNRHT